MALTYSCNLCNHRCAAGSLRGAPCSPQSIKDDMNIKRTKTASGADKITMKTKSTKHPKSGPRAYAKGDNDKFSDGYDKIWSKPPVCPVCDGKSESGTCPSCD